MRGARKLAGAIALSILVLCSITLIVTKFSAQSERVVPALGSNIIRIEDVNDKKTSRQNQIPELPDIDAIDVFNGGNFSSMSGDLTMSSRIVKVKGEVAQQVANLWRQLILGDSARCHTPAFGLRFYFKEKLLLQASMCWKCNNMYVWERSGRSLYGVDMGQPAADELFSLLKKIMK